MFPSIRVKNATIVAPHAGAWIEIIKEIPTKIGQFVAPHAGAWIEMEVMAVLIETILSRTPRGCVD